MLALQWEPLRLLAAVYPRARSMMQTMAFSASHPNRFIALCFHPCLFFSSSNHLHSRLLFYLHHRLCMMAAASNATNTTLDFVVVCGLALETWQDIGNAHGYLYKRNDRFMAANMFFLGRAQKVGHTLERSSVQGGAA